VKEQKVVMQFPGDLRSVAASSGNPMRVAYIDEVIAPEEAAALASLFPTLVFEAIRSSWPDHLTQGVDILIIGISAASGQQVERAVNFLRNRPARMQVLVALRDADVVSSRALTRAGAADVVPLPANEAVWALSLERLLSRETVFSDHGRKSGQVVALLKAGGGVGATSLGVQAAHLLAARAGADPKICFADLDLQFGTAALSFDLNEALTVTDCAAVGEVLEETQFATALAAHKSGIRVLAAPRDPAPLDVLTPQLVEALVRGLRRDFALTVLDLPSPWTAWTNHALQLADRVVLVTHLSVGHVHLVRRQLGIMALQNLDKLPLTLVCNAVTADQQNLLSLKAAERALCRPFDIVIPEEGRVMGAATNQGVAVSDVRRGTKLEKAIAQLADRIGADAFAQPQMQR
jgi:pilus assembly protein CpaE